ncbi:hypothetical protein Tco_0798874 [Tanacetum coccineum]
MVGSSIYIVTSVLTQRELDHHCATFGIPAELRPELPDQNIEIKDSPEGKIGMYTRFVEFANYRIPLSKFLLWNLNNRFFWIDASVCLLSTSWFRGTSVVKDPFSVDEAVDLPCVELLNENRTLIEKYLETFLCLVGLSRSFIETDFRPTLLHDNDEGLLNFVKSADPFKVKVGERTIAENKVPLITETKYRVISPSLQTISLVDHTIQDVLNVNSGKSPTSLWRLIRQGEQAAAGSGSAAPATEDATSSFVTHTPERALEDAFHDNVRTHPSSGRFVVLSSGSADTDIPDTSHVVLLVSLPQAGVSVHVAESVGDDRPLSAPELETGTLPATPSQGSSVDDFYESQTIDSAIALNVYVPNWNVTKNAHVDNPVTCWNLLNHVTPPGYWAMLRNQHDAWFLDSFNINSAQHVCMVSELRLRYEHEIMTREKYEKRFTDSATMVRQRDVEVAELKVKLEKWKSEAAKVEELCKRVSDLEATVAVKVGEAVSLTTQNAGLLEKVSALELERDGLKELDARITDVRCDMDNDLYPHMLTAIAGRRWVVGHGFRLAVHKCARSVKCRFALGKVILMAINKGFQQGLEAGIIHGKDGISLTQVEAYDPEVEEKYVAVVFEFEGVSFPLFDELESLKDSPLALIMSDLILKDDQVAVPIYYESGSMDREMILSDAIPAIRQSAERRGICLPLSSALGWTSGFLPPHDSSLGVADYQISTSVLSGEGGPTNPLPVVQPHDGLFDTSVLDKYGDV